ncbi:sialic acid-binding Ig-like lectin 14 [Dromiciops gliroides]|uniref:sialic acid-binding Ig-like lectin 14 n=1 Tax=Dromiciops gliroides TaxID=33562 RepID=UPI001CC60D1D|nr:sialic acid-binding Ig-like lectin 14 [Dromiciops gliroides]
MNVTVCVALQEMLLLLLLLPLLWEGSSPQTLDMQPWVSVQEGLCAQVPCTFNYSSSFNSNPVYGYWFSERTDLYRGTPVATNDPFRMVEGTAQGRFHLLGDPRKNNCSLSITDAHFSDSGRYYFRVENGHEKYSYTWEPLSVTVTGLIQKPDISVPEVLESGKSVTLKCTFPSDCGENRAFKFSWRGAALSSQPGSSGTSHSSEVSFIPGHQHHGTSLTCQLTLPGGRLRTERTVQLNITGFSAQDNSSWPLMFTLLRGALMCAGFLLTYGLTWLYYTWTRPLARNHTASPEQDK